MFKIDLKELDEFNLPKRQASNNLLNPQGKKLKSTENRLNKKSKLHEVSKEESNAVKESDFSFLPNALGQAAKLAATAPAELLQSHSARDSYQQQNSGLSVPSTETKSATPVNSNETQKSNGDVDEVAVIMSGIDSSDDAINFFARFGSDTPVKFVHLIENPDPKIYSPYELKVVELNDSIKEHYTMSSAGIVHICPGQPSECTPLSTFMRQGMMFKILRNIPFYKLYLHRKAFTIWKENVRYLLFTKQRKKMVDRLFFARKNSCQTIVAARRCLIDIQAVKVLNLDLRTPDKDKFYEEQILQTSKANQKFDTAMGLMCTEVQNLILEVNNLYSTTRQDHSGNALTFSDGAVEKAKSLVKMKQEKAEKKVLRQRAKLEHTTLPEFIRFVDYIAVEFLASMAISTCTSFFEELIKPRKTGVFETMVRFNSVGTAFSPTCQEFAEMLDKLLDSVINSCGNVSRVSYLNNTKGASAMGPNVQAIIRENKEFKSAVNNIHQRLTTDFAKAEEHATTYESVRPFYKTFSLEWDFEAFKARQHDMTSLRSIMEMIGNWTRELEKLRNKQIGILEVDSRRLKGELNPIRETRLSEIKEYIKDLARFVFICLWGIFL